MIKTYFYQYKNSQEDHFKENQKHFFKESNQKLTKQIIKSKQPIYSNFVLSKENN